MTATTPPDLKTTAGTPRFAAGDRRGRRVVSLLDVDPELTRRIPPEKRETARRHLMIVVHSLAPGRWSPVGDGAGGALGHLLLEGTLLRTVSVERRHATELLGPDDVLRPWEEAEAPGGLTREDAWTALEPVELAVLGWRFAAACARWPGLLDETLKRSTQRSARLMTLMCVSTIRKLDLRMLVLLRVLADRWGYVAPDGIHIDLPLTHETLARLACAQRPSVSTAIGRLVRAGLVARKGKGFVVPLELPDAVQQQIVRARAG